MIRHYSLILLFLSLSNVFAFHKSKVQNNNFNNTLETNTNQDSVIRNQMWEFILVSTNTYANQYKDVELSVHISNVDSSLAFDSYGFWDGDSTFKIRSYFPTVGEWTWTTSCTDTTNFGLHNKSGSVWVNEYDGVNKIYLHGGLKVSSNEKYLTYGDDTPFLWMGGTAWGLPMSANFEEWRAYIDDRHSKRFNIVQVAPARAHGGIWLDPPIIYPANRNGDVSFFADDKWNPIYWQEFDKFVEYANSKDIVVVVVGLAEPVYDILTEEDAKLFARNFSARMEGYHVVLSPSFDTWQTYQRSVLDSIGVYLTNSRHLITQHAGHSYDSGPYNVFTQYFLDKSYLDFSMNHSGHNGGDTEVAYQKAREWNIGLFNELPKKPIINSEAYYSAGKYSDQISYKAYGGTDENARALGWLSFLSGSLGYTYGAMGIWNYGELTNDEVLIPLDSAINFVSSGQMEYLVDFFETIAWWELVPNHSVIISSEIDETKIMAFAISDSGKFGAAYLPNNIEITLDMSVFSNKINTSWFNPITGIFIPGDQNILNSGEHTFTPSTPGEWALLLLEKKEIVTNFDYSDKWNMKSIPLATDEMDVTLLFSDSASRALKYDGTYSNIDTLSNGVGYWIKNSNDGIASITGSEPTNPINLNVGWNMIGTYNKEVSVEKIRTEPTGIISSNIFGFNEGYEIVDTLRVSEGYWIKSAQNGVMSYVDTSENSLNLLQYTEPQLLIEFKVTNELDDSLKLFFGLDSLGTNSLDASLGEAELPPVPPPGVFDIRIKLDDSLVSSYSDIRYLAADCYEHILQIQNSESSPGITLSWELPEGVTLNITDLMGGTLFDETFSTGKNSFSITNTELKNIKLTLCYSSVVLSQKEIHSIPNSYNLQQNFPNPFNPSTKIKFGLPEESLTSLIVYNMLGEEIAVLINKQLKAGNHEVEFNNFNLSSGIYFYILQAGSFVEVRKMILLK